MEEENGNFIYILFITIGVALIAIGVFYMLTDDKIELDGLDEYSENDNKKEDEKDEKNEVHELSYTVSQLDLVLNEEKTIKIDNKDINLKVSDDESIKLLFNDNEIISIDEGTINVYTLDKYLLVSTNGGSNRDVTIYIYDYDGKKVKEYHNVSNEVGMVFYDLYSDNKYEILGTRLDGENVHLSDGNSVVNVCNVDKLKELNAASDLLISAEYELKYYSDGKFELKKKDGSDETLIMYQQKVCNGDSE